MQIVLFIALSIMILCAIGMLRNLLVFHARMKAIEITSRNARASIERREENWRRFWDEFEACGSYAAMMFDLTKWRLNDFYPGIERSTDDISSQPIQ